LKKITDIHPGSKIAIVATNEINVERSRVLQTYYQFGKPKGTINVFTGYNDAIKWLK